MKALRPLLPIPAILVKFHTFFHTPQEISNFHPNLGREKWCEILRENLEHPVSFFQKCVSPRRDALLKLFSRSAPNSHAVHLEAFWDPPGQFSHQFSHHFSHKFHTNFTQFSHTGLGGLLRLSGHAQGGAAEQSGTALCMDIWTAFAAPWAHAWQRRARYRAP